MPIFFDPSCTALLLIDVQCAFVEMERAGRRRNNPDALLHVAALLECFREVGARIIHIRHMSKEADSLFGYNRPGFEVQEPAREIGEERVVLKNFNSAFIGTDLEAQLHSTNIDTLIIVGATTNHCVETTARMAGNMEFRTFVVRDATWTYDLLSDGKRIFDAEVVHAMSLANLQGEFAHIASTADIMAAIRHASSAARCLTAQA